MAQVVLSNLNHDFIGYVQRRFERYEAQLRDLGVPLRLEAAGDRAG
jgi:hypothetical protein